MALRSFKVGFNEITFFQVRRKTFPDFHSKTTDGFSAPDQSKPLTNMNLCTSVDVMTAFVTGEVEN